MRENVEFFPKKLEKNKNIKNKENNKSLMKISNINKVENIKLNHLLEDMCIYGNVVKEEIKMKKYTNKNTIKINEALKLETNDQGLFALGLLAHNLENNGITTLIETGSTDDKKDEEEAATSLQFISNGLIFRKKYDLHFDFGQKRNEE